MRREPRNFSILRDLAHGFLSIVLVLGMSSCSDSDDDDDGAPAEGPSEPVVVPLGDGLNLTILSVEVDIERRVIAEFTLEDDDGNPVDLSPLDGNPSFVLGWIDVDPETYGVRADGELLTCEPADVLPMAQRYFLF